MAKRKPKSKADYGTGSVYQDRDGSWRVAVRLKPGDKPTRRRAPDRQAAEALRQELIRQRDKGLDVIGGQQPVEAFTAYWFPEVYLQRARRERSNKHTLDMLELHILPAIGAEALNSITHADLQQLLNNLRRRPRPLKPLSAQTVHHVYSVLKQVFLKALQMNLIERDPTVGLELPEIVRRPKPVLTFEQVRQLLAVVGAHPHGTVYHLMAVLGLRLGEALALRRQDFSADFSEVTINLAIDFHSLALDTPKRESRRPLPVPPRLAARCRAQWESVKRQLDDPTPGFENRGLLSPSEAGTPIQPSNFEKAWNGYTQRRQTKQGVKAYQHDGFRARAGLPAETTLHDLRSFVATMLESLDTGQRTIGHILGHGAKNVTEVYLRRHLPTMRRALERLETALWAEAAAERQEQAS